MFRFSILKMIKEGSHPGWPLWIPHRSEPQIQAFSRTKMQVKKSQKNFYLSNTVKLGIKELFFHRKIVH